MTWRLNGSEVEGDLVLMKTLLFCCVNQVALMLTSWHLHEKSREVCIKARSPSTSFAVLGQVTKHTTVKWPIVSATWLIVWRAQDFSLPHDVVSCLSSIHPSPLCASNFSFYIQQVKSLGAFNSTKHSDFHFRKLQVAKITGRPRELDPNLRKFLTRNFSSI